MIDAGEVSGRLSKETHLGLGLGADPWLGMAFIGILRFVWKFDLFSGGFHAVSLSLRPLFPVRPGCRQARCDRAVVFSEVDRRERFINDPIMASVGVEL